MHIQFNIGKLSSQDCKPVCEEKSLSPSNGGTKHLLRGNKLNKKLS
jgi:hypothetical protein